METAEPAVYGTDGTEPEHEPEHEHEHEHEGDAVAAVEHALAEVEAQLGGLDALIAVRKTELDSLMALRKRAARALDADLGKPGPKPAGSQAAVSNYRNSKPRGETMTTVLEWLRANRSSDDDIRTVDVIAETGHIASHDTIRRAIMTLAERGQLRLDRTEKRHGQPSKVYRLV